jgi:hypothetical protein
VIFSLLESPNFSRSANGGEFVFNAENFRFYQLTRRFFPNSITGKENLFKIPRFLKNKAGAIYAPALFFISSA